MFSECFLAQIKCTRFTYGSHDSCPLPPRRLKKAGEDASSMSILSGIRIEEPAAMVSTNAAVDVDSDVENMQREVFPAQV